VGVFFFSSEMQTSPPKIDCTSLHNSLAISIPKSFEQVHQTSLQKPLESSIAYLIDPPKILNFDDVEAAQ
jgi:hypothetical protein